MAACCTSNIMYCCILALVSVVPPWVQLNTFQVVLATDGRRSLAVFNYAENGINWAGRDIFSGNAIGATAGYNVGDQIGYFKLPGSFSDDIQHIDNTTGNTGTEGQWVFVLDGELHIHTYITCMCTVTYSACMHMHELIVQQIISKH